MDECIFCKVVKEEIPSTKIWEDDNFLAILDVMPNTEGMTLVLPKKHYDSDILGMKDKDYLGFMLAAKKVSKILVKGLKVQRVALVAEGMGVDHAHVKLYPLHGLDKKFEEMWAKEKVFFDKYPGYITTKTGEKVGMEELQRVAEKIKMSLKGV